jgi:hypothetical protein
MYCTVFISVHRKKKVREFPVPSRDVTTKLSLGGNNDAITELFLPKGSLVSDIPAGDGKLVDLFLRCKKTISSTFQLRLALENFASPLNLRLISHNYVPPLNSNKKMLDNYNKFIWSRNFPQKMFLKETKWIIAEKSLRNTLHFNKSS